MELESILSESRWLRRLTARLADDPETAEDVYQQTVVAALGATPAVAARRSWLARVARNFALEDRRRRLRRALREEAVARPEATPSARELAERLEAHRNVAEVVQGLGHAQREVVYLHYFEGLSLREIATRLDIPIETVRTRHKRALVELRGRLDRRFGGRAAWLLPLLRPGALGRLQQAARASSPLQLAQAVGQVVAGLVLVASMLWWIVAALSSSVDSAPTMTASTGSTSEPARLDQERLPPGDTAGDARATSGAARAAAGEAEARFDLLVTGRVLRAEDRRPLESGVDVTLRRWTATGWRALQQLQPARDGSFELASAPTCRGGRFQLLVQSAGRASARREWALARPSAGDTRRVDSGDLQLAVGTRVLGTVLDTSGLPVRDAQVWHLPAAAEPRHTATTDQDGHFTCDERLAPSPRGDRLFVVGATGAGWRWIDLSRVSQDREITLRLFPSTPVELRVVDAQGRGIRGISVRARPAASVADHDWLPSALDDPRGPGRSWDRRTDANGIARWPALPVLGGAPATAGWPILVSTRRGPGTRLQADTETPVRATLEIDPDTLADASTASATEPGDSPRNDGPVRDVVGHVRDQFDAPVAGAAVRILEADRETVSDVSGFFRFDAVPTRGMTIQADPPAPRRAFRGRERARLAPTASAVRIRMVRQPGAARLRAEIRDPKSEARLDVRQALLCPVPGDPTVDLHPVRLGLGYVEADSLAVGPWALTVLTATGRTLSTGFEVHAVTETIERILTPPEQASLHGTIDTSELGADAESCGITLMHSYLAAPVSWVDPETGGPLPPECRVLGNPNCLYLPPGMRRFRLDGLSPHTDTIQVLVVDSGMLFGGIEAPLRAGKTSSARLRLHRGAEIDFEWAGPRAPGELLVWYREPPFDPAQRWSSVGLLSVDGSDRLVPPTLRLRPGSYEWGISDPAALDIGRDGQLWRISPRGFRPQSSGRFEAVLGQPLRVRLRR